MAPPRNPFPAVTNKTQSDIDRLTHTLYSAMDRRVRSKKRVSKEKKSTGMTREEMIIQFLKHHKIHDFPFGD